MPHNYRLDRWKLAHLHYPEHTIRLDQSEWAERIGRHLEIDRVQAVGIASTLPFVVMASRRYRDDNLLGRAFRRLRDRTLERGWVRGLDLALCERFGEHPVARQAANDLLFVCRTPRGSGG